MNKLTSLLFPTIVLSLCNCAISSEYVPVYIWETAKSNEVVPAIGHTSTETFKEILFQKIEKYDPYIVVFAEQNLSPEDFIDEGKTTFSGISKISAAPNVSYLPLVAKPIDAIKDLPARKFAELSINDIASHSSDARVLVIYFNDAKEDEDRSHMLKRHDAAIVEIYNDLLKKHNQVLAILTGIYSSLIVPEEITNNRQVRQILEDPPVQANDTRFLQTVGNLTFFVNSPLIMETPAADETKSDFTYIKITDITLGTNDEYNFKTNGSAMTMNISLSEDGYWYLNKFTYGSEEYSAKEISAPNNFAYHCDLQTFESTAKDSKKTITFQGLQFQLFTNASTGIFGDAYDCVGFTTAPIWSGLFITLILALIMTLGLTMMMDIKTMDRFDDPKGKTIIINAVE